MTNTVSALSLLPPDGSLPTRTNSQSFHWGCIWSKSGRDTLSDVCGVVSHVPDSCCRMGSMRRLYFLYLSKGNHWIGPIFCSVLPGRSLIRFGWEVRQTQHVAQGHVISPHTMFLCPLWAGQLLWIAWTSDVIHLVVKLWCPKDDVISLILVFRKNVFHGL